MDATAASIQRRHPTKGLAHKGLAAQRTCSTKDLQMDSPRLPVFQDFIEQLRAIWAREPDTQRRMELAMPPLSALLRDRDLQQRSDQWPSTEGRKNLLFYLDPDYGFAINGVVRVPGRTGSVHDHASAWVAYGVLTGAESLERYERVDDG